MQGLPGQGPLEASHGPLKGSGLRLRRRVYHPARGQFEVWLLVLSSQARQSSDGGMRSFARIDLARALGCELGKIFPLAGIQFFPLFHLLAFE
jgi:hypothetical protein